MSGWPLFLTAYLVWCLLTWPFSQGASAWQDLAVGLPVALLAGWLLRDRSAGGTRKWIEPYRYVWLVLYFFVLGYYIIKANLDVVYRVLHPQMPIRPGIVRVRTVLRSPLAIAMLANSITLTPGTLTVNATEDGFLYVHWIMVRAQDDNEAARFVLQRFEWFIQRIFE